MNLPLFLWKQQMHKPGSKVRVSGQYSMHDSYGMRIGGHVEFTCTKGEPFPPTPNPNSRFKLVDESK